MSNDVAVLFVHRFPGRILASLDFHPAVNDRTEQAAGTRSSLKVSSRCILLLQSNCFYIQINVLCFFVVRSLQNLVIQDGTFDTWTQWHYFPDSVRLQVSSRCNLTAQCDHSMLLIILAGFVAGIGAWNHQLVTRESKRWHGRHWRHFFRCNAAQGKFSLQSDCSV